MERDVLMIYLDNAATTKPCAEAIKAVMNGLENFGNPSSLYGLGVEAEKLLVAARKTVAESIGASADEIYFTSGATESNNTAIFGVAKSVGKRKKRIVTTAVEHPSVKEPCEKLAEQGFEVVRISPRDDGKIYSEDIVNAVDDNTCLVTCMLVNNETGRILPIEKAFSKIKKRFPQTILHCDCVQGYMKIPVKTKKLNADIISLSAHKIHGPKGIGAIYIKKGVHIPSLILGGGQEKNFRSGTESVPLICGFGQAVEKFSGSISDRYEHVKEFQRYLFEKCSQTDGVYLNSDDECSPYVNSIVVEHLKSEVLLHFLEEREIYISSGSACSKGKKSAVLKEFGVAEKYLDSTIRISFCCDTQKSDIDKLFESIKIAQKALCKIK